MAEKGQNRQIVRDQRITPGYSLTGEAGPPKSQHPDGGPRIVFWVRNIASPSRPTVKEKILILVQGTGFEVDTSQLDQQGRMLVRLPLETLDGVETIFRRHFTALETILIEYAKPKPVPAKPPPPKPHPHGTKRIWSTRLASNPR